MRRYWRPLYYGKNDGTYCVGEEGMWTSSAQEVPADFLVRPVKVRVGHAHGFGTHHLLQLAPVQHYFAKL